MDGTSAQCAWCGFWLRGGPDAGPLTHGTCSACAIELGTAPADDLRALPPERFRSLPFPAVELDGAGRVVALSSATEGLWGGGPAALVGRNFFTDVAPGDEMSALQSRHRSLVAAGVTAVVDELARLPLWGQPCDVRVVMTWDARARRGLLLLRET